MTETRAVLITGHGWIRRRGCLERIDLGKEAIRGQAIGEQPLDGKERERCIQVIAPATLLRELGADNSILLVPEAGVTFLAQLGR